MLDTWVLGNSMCLEIAVVKLKTLWELKTKQMFITVSYFQEIKN